MAYRSTLRNAGIRLIPESGRPHVEIFRDSLSEVPGLINQLYTLHLIPYILHHTPYTLHPTTYTLHHQMRVRRMQLELLEVHSRMREDPIYM